MKDMHDLPPLPPPDPNDPVMRTLLEAEINNGPILRAIASMPFNEQIAYEAWSKRRNELLHAFQLVNQSDDEHEIFNASRRIERDLCRWALEGRLWRRRLSELLVRLPPEPIRFRF